MYNDTIKVANKIITEKDLDEIFYKMWEKIDEYNKICKQETMRNQKYERKFQEWTVKDFRGELKFTVNFYDDTTIVFDSYTNFIGVFNNRIEEVKDIWVRYSFSYWVMQREQTEEHIFQSIDMNIYEQKMDIHVNLNSTDKKMDEIYKLIKEKIQTAPEKYDRTIQKKSIITNKIIFALGFIPAIMILTSLAFVPIIRQIYAKTYVLYPIAGIFLSLIIGGTFFGGKLDKLYKNILPDKKYAGYDANKHKSVYKDDIDKFLETSEILIGKNTNNLKNREEIQKLEKTYQHYLLPEIIALAFLSILLIFLGNI